MGEQGSPYSAPEKPLRARDLIGYWILGLCNNFGYVVMLSAAHDILQEGEKVITIGQFRRLGAARNLFPFCASAEQCALAQETPEETDPTKRTCNQMSTGAILLADIVPCLLIKVICPFLPPYAVPRILVAVLFSIAGFLLVAYSTTDAIGILGVCATSLASGLGESSLLAYSSHFHRNVISTWSSGTGGAGIFGSLAYAALRQIGFSPKDTMLVMISVPIAMFFTFTIILSKPIKYEINEDIQSSKARSSVIENVRNKKSKKLVHNLWITLKKMPTYMKYMAPLMFVYLFEYFINQGLFELVEFKEEDWNVLSHSEQYRWLNVAYQVGVFFSRSSVNVIHIRQIWIMTLLQGLNVVLYLTEVIFCYMPSYWIILLMTIWEGLLGGAGYVNTFYRVSNEVPQDDMELAMATVSLSDSFGISLAGFISMPVHNWICGTRYPGRHVLF